MRSQAKFLHPKQQGLGEIGGPGAGQAGSTPAPIPQGDRDRGSGGRCWAGGPGWTWPHAGPRSRPDGLGRLRPARSGRVSSPGAAAAGSGRRSRQEEPRTQAELSRLGTDARPPGPGSPLRNGRNRRMARASLKFRGAAATASRSRLSPASLARFKTNL